MMSKVNRTTNKWDNPAENDAFGREAFVNTIVKTIQSSNEGFNLGISARWGEGKSSILKQLQPKLISSGYKVLTFEPWKYTQDTTSIKRKFIIDIFSQLGKDYDESELYVSTENHENLGFLKMMKLLTGRLKIFFYTFGIISSICIFLLLLTKLIPGSGINVTQVFLTNIYIPFLISIFPILSKISELTIKQTIPKIESSEQFEKKFNDVVEEIMNGFFAPKKIIIFVDDLDRCSHTEVEQILTALFTFFNNKHCTYVITADHTVIRRYISHFLKLDDILDSNGGLDVKKTSEMRQKEATEYLKKIFQVNFIVPKVSVELLEAMVNNLILDAETIKSKNPYGEEYLTKLILNNFQGNPRKIKHFIRTLEFQLEAINEMINSLTDSVEKDNLNKVINSPELLAKILIIQDRFPDFYEQLVFEPRLLQRHEEGEVHENKDLQMLLAQEPKFFNSGTRPEESKTIDPYSFLYFSGTTGYSEIKVADPAEVRALARNADFESLSKIIGGLTDEPRNAQVAVIEKDFDSAGTTEPEKVNMVRSMFHVVSLIEEPILRLQKLKKILKNNASYSAEFSSLQSIDFGKFISYSDLEVIDYLFSKEPFTSLNIQIQILEAFASSYKSVSDKVVTQRFVDKIIEGLKRNDGDSITFMNMVKRMSEILIENKSFQEVVFDMYTIAGDPLKQSIFEFVFNNIDLFDIVKEKFEDYISSKVETASIDEVVSLLSNIPSRINKSNFYIQKIINSILNRLKTASHPEVEQIYNILVHPEILKEFDYPNALISNSLISLLWSAEPHKKSFIRGKLTEIIFNAKNKKEILLNVSSNLEKMDISEAIEVLNLIKNMAGTFDKEPILKKDFAKSLRQEGSKYKNSETSSLVIKTAEELDPLPSSGFNMFGRKTKGN